MDTQYKIEHDAENEQIVIRRVNNTTGADLADYPKITISLADLFAIAGAASVELNAQLLEFQDHSGATKQCYMMTTPPA